MQRGHKKDVKLFLNDLIVTGNVRVLTLPHNQLPEVLEATSEYNLDFEDAYQYATSLNYQLQLVSYDKHFDRTPQGRLTPK